VLEWGSEARWLRSNRNPAIDAADGSPANAELEWSRGGDRRGGMADSSEDVQIALSRFGFGPRPGDREKIGGDPRGAVKAELLAGLAALDDANLISSGQASIGVGEASAARRRAKGRDTDGNDGAESDPDMGGAEPDDADMDSGDGGGMPKKGKKLDAQQAPARRYYRAEVEARLSRVASADVGLLERLVLFWANHLAVSIARGPFLTALAGPYEREAIRPHVLGRFSDMLLAATRHPAMLRYLDNYKSVGPGSRLGARREVGLNENHARELLELHTLGVNGGYSQDDVGALARILTGWTIVQRKDAEDFGQFEFLEGRHEPGSHSVLGVAYPDTGEEQGKSVLLAMARHPATAGHIALRLATSFVADDPPQELVDAVASRFRETDGDLAQVSLALVESEHAWRAPRTKLRSPQEFTFAAIRALASRMRTPEIMRGLEDLGHSLWGPSSPKGFALKGGDWLAPDALTNRLDFAEILAERAGAVNAAELGEDLLGDVMTDETLSALKGAASPGQGLSLLLMSPEMQRR
jgi:uncharacterized protein (DUF1800 family)